MAFEMVDTDERLVERKGQGLGRRDADEQCADESSPYVTATWSMSVSVTPAWRTASSMTGMMLTMCLREAISGTTPPNFW